MSFQVGKFRSAKNNTIAYDPVKLITFPGRRPDNSPPKAEPSCGFDGEKCQKNNSTTYWAVVLGKYFKA